MSRIIGKCTCVGMNLILLTTLVPPPGTVWQALLLGFFAATSGVTLARWIQP